MTSVTDFGQLNSNNFIISNDDNNNNINNDYNTLPIISNAILIGNQGELNDSCVIQMTSIGQNGILTNSMFQDPSQQEPTISSLGTTAENINRQSTGIAEDSNSFNKGAVLNSNGVKQHKKHAIKKKEHFKQLTVTTSEAIEPTKLNDEVDYVNQKYPYLLNEENKNPVSSNHMITSMIDHHYQYQNNHPHEQQQQLAHDQYRQKKRKRRILFTKHQTSELEKCFNTKSYLNANERDVMAKSLGLSSTQVKIWFQNHRYKMKKSTVDGNGEKETTKKYTNKNNQTQNKSNILDNPHIDTSNSSSNNENQYLTLSNHPSNSTSIINDNNIGSTASQNDANSSIDNLLKKDSALNESGDNLKFNSSAYTSTSVSSSSADYYDQLNQQHIDQNLTMHQQFNNHNHHHHQQIKCSPSSSSSLSGNSSYYYAFGYSFENDSLATLAASSKFPKMSTLISPMNSNTFCGGNNNVSLLTPSASNLTKLENGFHLSNSSQFYHQKNINDYSSMNYLATSSDFADYKQHHLNYNDPQFNYCESYYHHHPTSQYISNIGHNFNSNIGNTIYMPPETVISIASSSSSSLSSSSSSSSSSSASSTPSSLMTPKAPKQSTVTSQRMIDYDGSRSSIPISSSSSSASDLDYYQSNLSNISNTTYSSSNNNNNNNSTEGSVTISWH